MLGGLEPAPEGYMGGKSAGVATSDPAAAPALFNARITPSRSLGRPGQMIALGGFAAASFVTALFFVALGYWPIAPFLGLDVALLAFAFWAVGVSGRAYEDVIVLPDVIVIRRAAGRARSEDRLPTAWTRLERQIDQEYGCQSLRLHHRHRSIPVAQMLSPHERANFAEALDSALATARKGGLAAFNAIAAPVSETASKRSPQ